MLGQPRLRHRLVTLQQTGLPKQLPKPDIDKLARLLVQMAKEQQHRQRRERP
jgi:hypothetical protein